MIREPTPFDSSTGTTSDPGTGASKEALIDVLLFTGQLKESNLSDYLERATRRLGSGGDRLSERSLTA